MISSVLMLALTASVSLRHPWVQFYYVEPTVVAGEAAKISYYVTDFDHSKVRFGDDSARFDVTLGWSADGTNWTEQVQKGVRSGDGAFALEGLARGDYLVRLSCVDGTGVVSRTVWNDFRVRTAEELAITAAQTARPTLEELAAYGVVAEQEDFYAIVPVELGADIRFPRDFRERNLFRRKEEAARWAAANAAISNAVERAIAGEEGQKSVAAHAKGYVVFAPAKGGQFIFRARDWRRIVPGAEFDAEATERRASETSKGLTRYLADQVAAGRRKVVLPKAVFRISCTKRVLVPNGLTLDLNGGKLKINGTKAKRSCPIMLYRTEDAHLVNGRVEGVYFEYDYERSEAGNPEFVRCIGLYGDARRCSFENLDISYCTASGTGFGVAWLEKADDTAKNAVREWTKNNPVVSFAAQPGHGRGAKRTPDEHWEKGRLDAQGAVRDGDLTVCCGHSFVYEDCSMRWWMWQRVHSPLVRNCTVKGGTWDCLTRTRNGYTRFENNTYVGREFSLGTPANEIARKKVAPDWEIVLDGGVFRGAGTNALMKVTVGETGRFRNCTFENCKILGPKDRFTDCTFGAAVEGRKML